MVNGQVAHQTVTLGQRGEFKGQPMVEITGVTPGAMLIRGALGTLREGTTVKLATGTP
jgi:hypothetical protein